MTAARARKGADAPLAVISRHVLSAVSSEEETPSIRSIKSSLSAVFVVVVAAVVAFARVSAGRGGGYTRMEIEGIGRQYGEVGCVQVSQVVRSLLR
jgi:hypothetical protein